MLRRAHLGREAGHDEQLDEDLLDVVVLLRRHLESDALRRRLRQIVQLADRHRPLRLPVALVSDDHHRRRLLPARSPDNRRQISQTGHRRFTRTAASARRRGVPDAGMMALGLVDFDQKAFHFVETFSAVDTVDQNEQISYITSQNSNIE